MNPLTSPSPPEVALRAAPLVHVVAQVRFAPIMSIEQRAFIAPFQEAIRTRYPVLRPDRTGQPMDSQGIVWQFADVKDEWSISLSMDFLAIETVRYQSRDDFINRFGEACDALARHVGPGLVNRFGLRYTNRVINEGPEEMRRMIRREILGIAATELAPYALHAVSEAQFHAGEEQILACWGHLPPHATIDPVVLEPINERSWFLDFDVFTEESMAFDANRLRATARRLAERGYAFFRWVVTDDFLRRYGGEP